MCQREQHEEQLVQVRQNFNAQMKLLEEKVHSHSVVLHKELTHQAEKNDSILRIQCFWRRKLAIRARIKLEHAISAKVVAEAARVAIQANRSAMKLVGNAVADVAAASARAMAEKEWGDTMSASWEERFYRPKSIPLNPAMLLRMGYNLDSTIKIQALVRGQIVRSTLKQESEIGDDEWNEALAAEPLYTFDKDDDGHEEF
ncbi:MAG: hypothetical protein CMD74_02555 [Gammaproteobacteria bacterium]|nr:hypothetical protein [Gammaproteobacteria bacterium]